MRYRRQLLLSDWRRTCLSEANREDGRTEHFDFLDAFKQPGGEGQHGFMHSIVPSLSLPRSPFSLPLALSLCRSRSPVRDQRPNLSFPPLDKVPSALLLHLVQSIALPCRPGPLGQSPSATRLTAWKTLVSVPLPWTRRPCFRRACRIGPCASQAHTARQRSSLNRADDSRLCAQSSDAAQARRTVREFHL
jgi:hypothetical protein